MGPDGVPMGCWRAFRAGRATAVPSVQRRIATSLSSVCGRLPDLIYRVASSRCDGIRHARHAASTCRGPNHQSGRRGSNPRLSRWERDVLPLNYARTAALYPRTNLGASSDRVCPATGQAKDDTVSGPAPQSRGVRTHVFMPRREHRQSESRSAQRPCGAGRRRARGTSDARPRLHPRGRLGRGGFGPRAHHRRQRL